MKSKTFKRCIAIMLCMVIVLSGSGYLLAESLQEGTTAGTETEVQSEEGTTVEEEQNSTDEGTVEVDVPEDEEEQTQENAEAPAQEETPSETEEQVAETPVAETPAEEVESEEPILQLTYEDDKVKITVDAIEAGNIPNGATLSVAPIEKKEITSSMSADEKAKAEKINEQYDLTEQKLQEKAENETYDIAGFLAYDITFVDANGNKLEPNGDVKVSMKYKQAEIPEEAKKVLTENDDQNLDVTVMHLEEDEKGEVKEVVDMVADENETATVETTSAMKVKKAEFVTDSFSVFTVTWSKTSYTSSIYINVVDENGNGIGSNSSYTFSTGEITGDWSPSGTSEPVQLSTIKNDIANYNYSKATLDSVDGAVISHIRCKMTSSWYGSTTYTWQYSSDGNNWTDLGGKKIYFVYENASGLRITDDIVNTGALKAEYAVKDGEEAVSGVSYTWYRSDSEDGTYTEVEKINYQGDKTNLSADGMNLYPAFDDGARKWYKVKVTLSDGTEVEAAPVQVVYYNQLQNGSFETPKYDTGMNQVSNESYAQGNGVWQTTGTGAGDKLNKDIEILTNGNYLKQYYAWNKSSYSDGHDASNAAYEGNQFAELNCEADGALYQDVLTQEGTPLNYWLAHRARGKSSASTSQYDTMFLVMMPTKIAEENKLDNQANLEVYLTKLGLQSQYKTKYSAEGQEQIYYQNGVKVLRVTSSNWNWHSLSETNAYTPTSSLTRFFFMSGDTAANDNTVGNFLDRVGFSQELPPVSDDEFSIQIEKKFRGLGNDDISKIKNNIQFEISATKGGSELSEEEIVKLFGTKTISGANMSQMADGTLVYTIANRKIGVNDKYQVTVTEKNAEAEGYKLEATAQTKVLVDGKESATIDDSQITELKGKVTATVTFTNSYKASNYKKVNFKKVWDDSNNKFNTRPDNLTVTLHASIVVEENGETVEKSLDELTKTATLTSKDDWACSWDVPVYYEYNGVKVKINYSVTEEGEINSDYVYQSPTDGIAVSGDGTDYTYTNFDNVKTSGDAANTTKGAAVKNGIFNLSLQSVRLLASPLSVLSGEEESSLGQPAHNKYIAYNANTADYTLNLDVTGAKGDTPGVDVLFVIDTSGSMADKTSLWGTTDGLLTTLKSLLTEQDGIIDKIFEKTGNVNSVAFVSFAGKSQTRATSWYQTSGKESFKQEINALKATGGTNWTYAMMKASEVLGQKSSSKNEKVVVFLSDGAPTFSVNSRGNETGNGSDTKNSYYTDAANKVSNSSSLKNAQMYSVYLTSDTQTGMKTFSDKLSNSELVNGTNLATALEEILSKVIPTYKNVVITDTLSEYVDFAESTPTITVTKKSAAGAETTLSSSEYTASVSGKTITVRLLGGASLEDGAKYTVSFRVKPSEAANNYFNTNSGAYPHTGEAGTGVTSAGQKGFYSNNSANTKVSYEIDGTEGTKTATYPKPVVQVTTHKLSYEKIWNQPDGIDIPDGDVELTVTYTDGIQKTVILNEANGYKTEETVSVTKNIASVTEEPVDGYTPSYEISEDKTKAVVTNSYSKVTSGSIKVVKQWKGNGPQTPIRVSLWQQNTKDGTATRYKDIVTLSKSNEWSYEWTDLPKEQGTGNEVIQYTYAVREENIPANYTSNITYSYGTEETVATITNEYDSDCDDENYYIANVLQTEQWTMNKIWQDSVDQSKRPDSLDVTVNDMTFRLTKDNWTKTVTVLKKKDATYVTSEDLSNDSYEQVEKVQNVTEAGMEVTFVNKLKLKSITVHKEWNDGNISTRPRSIQFKLLYRTGNTGDFTQYGNEIYTITEEDRDNGTPWSKVINDLPVTYEYKVEEVEAEGREGYLTDVTSDGDTFTITNTLKWSAKKVSEQWDDETVKNLKGAEFELKSGSTVIATGKSGSDGNIVWTLQSGQNVDLQKLDGEYTVVETKAPEGYMIHEGGWTLTFSNGLLTTFDGNEVKGTATDGVVINLSNKQLYELPETGGIGIFWYTIGGMLLMMAAALVLYKRKCREVLNK